MLPYRISRRLENPHPHKFSTINRFIDGEPTIRILTTLKQGYLSYRSFRNNALFVRVRPIRTWPGKYRVVLDIPANMLSMILTYSSTNDFKVVYRPTRKSDD